MAEPRSPRPQGSTGRRPLGITVDAVWASPAAGKGPREPGGWLSTVRATAHREGALSETPQGELTREKYRTKPVPHGGCRPGCAPGSCARGPGAVALPARVRPPVSRHRELLPIWDVGSVGWVALAWDLLFRRHSGATLGSHMRSVFLRHHVSFAARDVPFVT